jgi:anti-sigma factor ChrR (cupin superfamily)
MSSTLPDNACPRLDDVSVYALRALNSEDEAAMRAHLGLCAVCQQELAKLSPIIDAFAGWPTDVLRPSPSSSLWDEVTQRVSSDMGSAPIPRSKNEYSEPDWEEVAAGIWCKLLATDKKQRRTSMLVRLAPGTDYPPHRHAGVEELHLLEGELWIEDHKLYPGDYNRAEPGTGDKRVWSETGCTCVLITSPDDVLG